MGALKFLYPGYKVWKILLCIIFLVAVITISFSCAEVNGPSQYKSGISDPVPDGSGSQSMKNITLEEEPVSFYEIRFISSDLLDTILSNRNSEDEVLKIGPGMTIGMSTSHILYLRSDLQSDDYLLKNQNSTDMKEDITEHLLDISFGRDNSNLTLLKKDLKYMIWFDAVYTKEDISNSLQFARLFNNLSSTSQFEDEEVMTGDLMDYEENPNYYYNIKIVPKQYLVDYKKDKYHSSTEEILNDKSGDIVGILANEYVYLWDGLSGDERKYLIIKSLLWGIGLHGQTSTHPESFFYKKKGSSTNLSDLDLDAIKLLYGGRLKTGMTPDEIRKALDISIGTAGNTVTQ